MSYNHRREMNKEKNHNKKTIKVCLEHGAPSEMISSIIAFDHEVVKGNRRYKEHTEKMPKESILDGEQTRISKRVCKQYLAAFSVEDEQFQDDIFGWLNSIEDPRLYAGLKSLSDEQIELIYRTYEKGMTFAEYARAKGISKAAVSQRHRVIVNKLKKFR